MVVSTMTAEHMSPELPLVLKLAWRVGYHVDGWKRLMTPETATEEPPCFHCAPERQCEVFFALTAGFSQRRPTEEAESQQQGTRSPFSLLSKAILCLWSGGFPSLL